MPAWAATLSLRQDRQRSEQLLSYGTIIPQIRSGLMKSERNGRRGRPRAFEEDRVLDAAIKTFASNGFTAASLSELTAATGLSAGSLYKAFGDKDGVFARALRRYIALHEAELIDVLGSAGCAREKIEAILRLYASWSQDEPGRTGCLVIAGIGEIDLLAAPAAAALRDVLERRRELLADLVVEGQQDGSVRTTASPGVVADLMLSLTQGMRVVGKGGLFPGQAEPLVTLALRVLD